MVVAKRSVGADLRVIRAVGTPTTLDDPAERTEVSASSASGNLLEFWVAVTETNDRAYHVSCAFEQLNDYVYCMVEAPR